MSQNRLQNSGWVAIRQLGRWVDIAVSWNPGQRNNTQPLLQGWQRARQVQGDLVCVYLSNTPWTPTGPRPELGSQDKRYETQWHCLLDRGGQLCTHVPGPGCPWQRACPSPAGLSRLAEGRGHGGLWSTQSPLGTDCYISAPGGPTYLCKGYRGSRPGSLRIMDCGTSHLCPLVRGGLTVGCGCIRIKP